MCHNVNIWSVHFKCKLSQRSLLGIMAKVLDCGLEVSLNSNLAIMFIFRLILLREVWTPLSSLLWVVSLLFFTKDSLNKLQRLICHKTKLNEIKLSQPKFELNLIILFFVLLIWLTIYYVNVVRALNNVVGIQ